MMKYLLATLSVLTCLTAAATTATDNNIVSTRIDFKYRGLTQSMHALLRTDGKESNFALENDVSLKIKASEYAVKDASKHPVLFAMNIYDTKSGALLGQPQFLVNRDGTRATMTNSTKTSEPYELSIEAKSLAATP